MARCKCRICGKALDTSEAFRVDGKPVKYFCSETEYNAEEERKRKAAEDKDRVYRLICDVMGEQEIINSALWKEVQVWHQVADDEKIAKYLEENKDYLTSAIGRIENKIYNRIRYLSAILKNSLGDYKPKLVNEPVKMQPKVVIDNNFELFEPATITQVERVILEDVEDDLI